MPKTLDAYRQKRDFSKTPEPAPEEGAASGFAFVVQKHDATRLHYDFRLELDGVMKSWAVTRGPSLVPTEKRLAVQTEDHPIAYNAFEGIIPKGQYGGGTVMIWDRGTWQPDGDPHRGLKKGHLEFELHGEKLSGRWHLVRMKKKAREKTEPWLLIKSDDEAARGEGDPDILEEAGLSVVSGRSLPEIAKAKERVWTSNKGDSVNSREAPKPKPAKAAATSRASGKRAALPGFVPPELATLVAQPLSAKDWLYEVKFDGYRLQARLDKGKVTLFTRNGLDWTARFPAIAEAVAALPAKTAILDGEAVVEDESGVSSFSLLQQDLGGRGGKKVSARSIYFAFDLLHLDGQDLTGQPLRARKEALAALIAAHPHERLRYSEHFESNGEEMVRHACRLGLEGIIGKRANAPYRSGRGPDWVKVKCTDRAEFVIVGYVPSAAQPRAVGSLVLGYYEKGRLIPAGRVGTGFTRKSAGDIWKKLDGLTTPKTAFASTLSAEARRGVVWTKPELVAEIEFRGWTHDGSLRHASFKGLREDKPAKEVVREMAKSIPADTDKPAAKAQKPTLRKGARAKQGVEVAGVPLSHPERELWSGTGITKQGLAEFYARIADHILPHLVDRPLSLVRCPSGADAKCFFQKHAWAGLGEDIREIAVPGDDEKMLAISDVKGLVSLVQSGVLEIHPWGSRLPNLDKPDMLIFDLDPGDGVSWSDLVSGAEEVRARLGEVKLESFVKTTGGKGLHVVVPLVPEVGWDDAKLFTRVIAEQMAADSPQRFVAKMAKNIRKGRIFVDYLRNGQGATAIAAFSTRARDGAPVSVPLGWTELKKDVREAHFNVLTLEARLKKLKADPWEGFFSARQSLTSVLEGARRHRK